MHLAFVLACLRTQAVAILQMQALNLLKKVTLGIFGIILFFIVVFRRDKTPLQPVSNQFSSTSFQSVSGKTTIVSIKATAVEKTYLTNSTKIILYWNAYFNRTDMMFGFGQQPFVDAGCKITNCVATNDRNLLNQSDGVMIHAGNYLEDDLPTYRFPHQRFIFYNYETLPGGSSLPCFSRPHFYNWTMTFRRDSDIYVGMPYGALRRRKNFEVINQLPAKLKFGESPPKVQDLFTRKYPKLANRTKLIAWFNSHCPTHSQREDYVKKLAEFIPVDIYGRCGSLECLPRNGKRCDKRVLVSYRFYLAAENSLCPDYVTEKFYRALLHNVVPVVFGGADYTHYAPPDSYVNIADFRSPKELSEYLLLLAKNDALYSKYFNWKKDYEVINQPLDGWCDLCEKLNDPTLPAKSYSNMSSWWYKLASCLAGSSYLNSIPS
ncbi:putative Alpha1,3-fucosyltransferase C [Daphnia magna]|uniref:Fucosyltransferase n=1 Tax=Daphnia magna TaxID=35525 RepID=A0A164XZ16_9CRUS|nr:putative Alpha1,3-fucosyltransferase C [Daphnia magna]